MMQAYTVIGYYETNNARLVYETHGADAIDAMVRTARAAMRGYASDLIILGAIEGHQDVTGPCDDSESLASAADVAELGDEGYDGGSGVHTRGRAEGKVE